MSVLRASLFTHSVWNASANAYTTVRPAKLAIPFSMGGHVAGRILAKALHAELWPLANKSRAGAQTGTASVAGSKPDHCALPLVDTSVVTTALLQKASYKTSQLKTLAKMLDQGAALDRSTPVRAPRFQLTHASW